MKLKYSADLTQYKKIFCRIKTKRLHNREDRDLGLTQTVCAVGRQAGADASLFPGLLKEDLPPPTPVTLQDHTKTKRDKAR